MNYYYAIDTQMKTLLSYRCQTVKVLAKGIYKPIQNSDQLCIPWFFWLYLEHYFAIEILI